MTTQQRKTTGARTKLKAANSFPLATKTSTGGNPRPEPDAAALEKNIEDGKVKDQIAQKLRGALAKKGATTKELDALFANVEILYRE